MTLRTLTLRGVPDPVLKALRAAAKRNRRSLNAELLVVLEAVAADGALPGPGRVTASEGRRRAGATDLRGPADQSGAATVVREPVTQPYEVRQAFREADLSRLRSDLALTPEQRVHLAEELARIAPDDRPRPRFGRVIQFDRYEDYLDWKRYGDRGP